MRSLGFHNSFLAFPLLAAMYFLACEGRPHTTSTSSAEATIASSPAQNISGDELLQQTLKLAASANPADQKRLQEALTSKDFLFRLDSRDDYRMKAVKGLRLAKLFQAMKQNGSPAMHQTLLALARTYKQGECDACDQLLLQSLAIMRPAPAEAMRFFTVHSEPDSIQLGFAIDALCENGSTPALALLEKRFSDSRYEPQEKVSWLRRGVLQHRRNPGLLQVADRWLTASLPKSLRPTLVEVLFDYRPGEWYREHNPPQPDPQSLTAENKKLLQKIGATALKKVVLNATQRAAVTKTMSELK